MTSRPRHTPRLSTLCSTRAMEALLCTFTVLCSFTGGVAFVTSVQQAGLGQRRPTPELSSTKSSGESSTPSWRYELDDLVKAASPWGSLVEAEIIATDLVKQLPDIAADVRASVERGNLLSDVVVGKGTEARSIVDGLTAVNRQLRQDIFPKVLEEAPRIAKAVPRRGTAPQSPSRTGRRTGPMEGVAEALYSVKKTARGLTPQKIREGLRTVAAESENIFSRTPSGLYSPDYSLEDAGDGFEVRRYASYAVCSATMTTVDEAGPVFETLDGVTDGSGEGFNTLAGYLFGNNTQEVAMDMTTPVNIDVSPTGGRTMSFVMPKDIPAGEAPIPRDPRVNVNDVPTELLAVREFPGFATDGEVARQLDSLLWALQRTSSSSSPWCAEDPSGKSYRLMQYNPPYTLPFRRTNAIAVRVAKGNSGDSAPDDGKESNATREEVSSTISQSSS